MSGNIIFRVHVIQRMFERNITAEDVIHVIGAGETIKTYPDDQPYPGRLILGWREMRPFTWWSLTTKWTVRSLSLRCMNLTLQSGIQTLERSVSHEVRDLPSRGN